ncbi:MAG: hypothetical protein RL702_1029 [Pseudomonadota bacterium]|jgi:hypothetical protein|nr:PilZ domain-containing protein [Novosphingobium sp.]HQN53839.1 PilZ domain-containing protein [Novosphingobium sp.]HQQ08507.1 PilZ domain-containing protein [Novosphingobium sp.]
MVAKLKLGLSPAETNRPLTRRGTRRPASSLVLVTSSHGDRAKAVLRDISIYGCNLVSEDGWLRVGMFVGIRLSPERTVQAIIRWSREDTCGVEFLRPIPDAEADELSGTW